MPSENLLNAIPNFPTPKNIMDARSWFVLVNQVAWAYFLSFIMLTFWNPVKQNTPLSWNESLKKAFQE